ncbi:MAG: DUF885 domain-containing protein [Alphaproteobacteria bacterium]|nr:DUF885 domain-containing protein [Alphaproteobacteria bacterium]MBU1514613.1 DUF885 domain-containing protein [Alphaproteobacteria bacterium]MBU2096755.1 DUF885 domain-containing protein [Alphaproteobacteria bacterium]MBU2150387.1 DUF885 domain-containing protein [Alphaproteobacteria bacterium]MBU2306612.1 DUF885 domain-containing protein [Alphaproteobacteria bacterium]
MRLSRRDFGLGLAGAAALSAGGASAAGPDADLTAYLDAQFEEELQMSPERLTRLGRKDLYDKLTDRSDAAAGRAIAWRRKSVAGMKATFDPAKLGEDARTSYDIWELELERAEATYKWRNHAYVFARGGPHTGLPNFLINQHRVDTPADMQAYIARVAAIGPALDQTLDQAKASAAAGVRMPRFSYDQSLEEVRRITAGAPFDGSDKDSALYADATSKLEKLRTAGKIDQATEGKMLAAVSAAMTGQMKPAYDRLTAWLVADRPNTTADAKGAGSLPDGQAYYAAMLLDETTTDMTADQIHALGLSEVKRIRGEMETLKAKIGFKGSLEEFFVVMRTDKRFFLPNDDAGRAEYLKLAEGYLAGMKAKLPTVFGRLPKSDLIVKRVELFREEPGGAAHYSSGAPDGSRPGVFYVHLADTAATPTFELEGTAYHEGWPGHHMQISLAQEMTGLPKFRGQYNYGAYVEGWGLYSELLAKEMDFYKDPYSDFGRLGREIWRGIRLVVDSGIHAKGWSEAQALDYYRANSPQPEGKIRSEIRRYFVSPGQATSYKVGMVKILALRAQAKATLGPKFDIKGFHEAVVGAGSLPLALLETRVNRWVAARQKA